MEEHPLASPPLPGGAIVVIRKDYETKLEGDFVTLLLIVNLGIPGRLRARDAEPGHPLRRKVFDQQKLAGRSPFGSRKPGRKILFFRRLRPRSISRTTPPPGRAQEDSAPDGSGMITLPEPNRPGTIPGGS